MTGQELLSVAFAMPATSVARRHTQQHRVRLRGSTGVPVPAPARWRCAAPRFRSTEDPESEGTKRSFSSASQQPTAPLTPNQRVLLQVRESMKRLGVVDIDAPVAVAPVRKPVDISRVNPASALLGSVGAFGIFYCTWSILQFFVQFYVSHPFETDMYVLRRINSIVRTVLVGIFALASGISFVTSFGLLLLCGRTGIAALTGEFRNAKLVDSDGDEAPVNAATSKVQQAQITDGNATTE
jgi:Protein of unknown function (DUF3082)